MNNKVSAYILKLTSAILVFLPLLVLYPSFSLEDSEENDLRVLLKSEMYAEFGFLHVANGEHVLAIYAFERAIQLNPDSGVAHYGLGVAYKYMGLKSYALKEYETLISLDSNLGQKLYDVIHPGGIKYLRG